MERINHKEFCKGNIRCKKCGRSMCVTCSYGGRGICLICMGIFNESEINLYPGRPWLSRVA